MTRAYVVTSIKRALHLLPALLVAVASFAASTSVSGMQDDLAPHEPVSGTYLGFNIDWASDTPQEVSQRLGLPAASYVDFFSFPLTDDDRLNLGRFLDLVGMVGGIGIVTLEPIIPLEEITPQLAEILAMELGGYNERGIRILVRFAHEMNGSWYAWSQQPTAYIDAFRTIAKAVHAMAPLTGMLWAPNNGDGYPFSSGAFRAVPTQPDFALLDTDGDGALTERDDPYAPYYPGDDVVDWVGMSLYHWGAAYPWGENEIPEPNKFIELLRGSHTLDDDRTSRVPDFYAEYVENRNNPLAIVETAAFYRPGAGGADELSIKQAWWRQVFSAEMLREHPGIKMINWFEWRKQEPEVNNAIVDWTVTYDEAVVSRFHEDLPVELLHFAPIDAAHADTP